MSIRRLSYLDIPKDLRDQKVREVQAGLRSLLADPTVSAEQRTAARSRSDTLQRWADGALPVSDTPPVIDGPVSEESPQLQSAAPQPPSEPQPEPQRHEVEVVEALAVSEGSEPEPESEDRESVEPQSDEPESIDVEIEPESDDAS